MKIIELDDEEVILIRALIKSHKINWEFDLRKIVIKDTEEAKIAIHTIDLSKSILDKL